VLDLFYPPKPVALKGPTRRLLLLDARGEVAPDLGQKQPKRPTMFDGLTPDEINALKREINRATYLKRLARPGWAEHARQARAKERAKRAAAKQLGASNA
jgi:hypothetical protein